MVMVIIYTEINSHINTMLLVIGKTIKTISMGICNMVIIMISARFIMLMVWIIQVIIGISGDVMTVIIWVISTMWRVIIAIIYTRINRLNS